MRAFEKSGKIRDYKNDVSGPRRLIKYADELGFKIAFCFLLCQKRLAVENKNMFVLKLGKNFSRLYHFSKPRHKLHRLAPLFADQKRIRSRGTRKYFFNHERSLFPVHKIKTYRSINRIFTYFMTIAL